jgi:predicted 3-demethylubiquinone-9 3-methyltransferase (glyoxalase superfamily)
MQKIVPHLWYDKEAVEAANFYVSTFGRNSKVNSVNTIHGTPSGDCDIVSFNILGYELASISAGPYFQMNPSISMMVNFDPSKDPEARTRIDEIWAKLSEGGKALMPLDKYPFSERYGWIQDKYGFSWQLIFTKPEGLPAEASAKAGEDRPVMLPSLLFITETCDKAEEATNFYMSLFKNSKRGAIARYPAGMEPNKEGSLMFTDFTLEDHWFVAMDSSAQMHQFKFNEGISLMINCKDQAEIDFFWEKLSAVPESEQCGWVKDKYGVSWQIIPENMGDLINSDAGMQAMMKMKKINIEELKKAS